MCTGSRGKPCYIYALIDPRTREIRYIGSSMRPHRRLQDHLRAARAHHRLRSIGCTRWKEEPDYRRSRFLYRARMQWLYDLQQLRLRPRLLILDTCDAFDSYVLRQVEAHYISVKAYYALARFQAGRPFRPWLLRIVSNEAHNRQAADSRRAALLLRAAETQQAWEAGASPEGATLRAERRTALLRALATLSADDRLIITYRYFLDLSEVEMADALDCPRGTVKSRLSRALGRLRATLGNDRAQAGDEGGSSRV